MMNRIALISVSAAAILAGTLALRSGCTSLRPRDRSGAADAAPGRIVSLSPSVTEILFALGLADRIVGVTRYCKYPEAARSLRDVGGYYDPNYELILRLQPDLVILPQTQQEALRRFAGDNIRTLAVRHDDLDGIFASISSIGEVTGTEQKADALLGEMRRGMEAVTEKVKDLRRPRVLLSAGRILGTGRVDDLYIAGRGNIYSALVELAGGANCYDGPVSYPSVSAEGVLRMNPDVVLELTGFLEKKNLTAARIRAEWETTYPNLEAVREDRVHVIAADYAVIPGPRIVKTLRDMARAVHPDADWPDPR